MAGIGAAINTGAVGRDDTVAVIGCGGVGDAICDRCADGDQDPQADQVALHAIQGAAVLRRERRGLRAFALDESEVADEFCDV